MAMVIKNSHDPAVNFILSDDDLNVLATHQYPRVLFNALFHLQQNNILNDENRQLVAKHLDPSNLTGVFVYLSKKGILNDENRQLVAKHLDPSNLSVAFVYLSEKGILNDETKQLVAKHSDPSNLSRAFVYLSEKGILNDEIKQLVTQSTNPYTLAIIIYFFSKINLLNRANIIALINHSELLTNEAVNHIWSNIPLQHLTQGIFNRLIKASESANPLETLKREKELILAELQPPQTHTASIHLSVSESATNLMNTYRQNLNVDTTIETIKSYVNSLSDDSIKNQAAKKCIERITHPDWKFVDPKSGVSILQLLALAYTAIHDDDKRIGSLEDAKGFFIEGLYEIQRGNNLNEEGQDNKFPNDESICLAGSFNKLIEKLYGIHPDVQIKMINRSAAIIKFQSLAKNIALAELKSRTCPSHQKHASINDLLTQLENDQTLEAIWEDIKDKVASELWEEFKEAYGDNPRDQHFIGTIESGRHVALPDLSDVKIRLESTDRSGPAEEGAAESGPRFH